MHHSFRPEILFQRHPSRKYFNDGLYQNFLRLGDVFGQNLELFLKLDLTRKKFFKKSKIYDSQNLFWNITSPCSNSGAFIQKIFEGMIEPEKILVDNKIPF